MTKYISTHIFKRLGTGFRNQDDTTTRRRCVHVRVVYLSPRASFEHEHPTSGFWRSRGTKSRLALQTWELLLPLQLCLVPVARGTSPSAGGQKLRREIREWHMDSCCWLVTRSGRHPRHRKLGCWTKNITPAQQVYSLPWCLVQYFGRD